MGWYISLATCLLMSSLLLQSERAIIFVCHSLGGLVCQDVSIEALVIFFYNG